MTLQWMGPGECEHCHSRATQLFRLRTDYPAGEVHVVLVCGGCLPKEKRTATSVFLAGHDEWVEQYAHFELGGGLVSVVFTAED